jgi:hypothetical protein
MQSLSAPAGPPLPQMVSLSVSGASVSEAGAEALVKLLLTPLGAAEAGCLVTSWPIRPPEWKVIGSGAWRR